MKNQEYFLQDLIITGKHARYIDKLWEKNKVYNSYIKTLYDLYVLAVVLGLRMGKTSKIDKIGDDKKTLQAGQMNNRRKELSNLMILVLLVDETSNLEEIEKINRAFRGPNNDEEFESNVELFNSYFRAGVEYLYEMLVERNEVVKSDGYVDARIQNIMNLISTEIDYLG